MALKIQTEDKSHHGKTFVPGERLCLNKAGDKLVSEGDPDAASLFCSQFQEVSRAEYDRLTKPGNGRRKNSKEK